MTDDVAGGNDRRWTRRKTLTALLATAGAVVGLATGILTLWDRIFAKDDARETTVVVTPGQKELSVGAVSQLSDGVQLSRFEELLGPALSRQRLFGGAEHEQSTWTSTDVAVVAYSDSREQVVAYTLTALSPAFTPVVEHVRGGVRLSSSVFADIDDEPQSVAGVYPPNGQWSYQELHGGGFATQHKQVLLTASWRANANDSAATKLNELGCLPFSVFERRPNCSPGQLEAVRSGLHITSVTIGEPAALETLGREGALFFADVEPSD